MGTLYKATPICQNIIFQQSVCLFYFCKFDFYLYNCVAMKKRKIIPSSKFVNILCFALILVIALFVYVFGIRSVVERDATMVISRGDTVSDVASRLESRGLIDSESLFKVAVRANGGEIQSGQYDIPRGTSIWRIADMFARGEVAATTVVIPEGLTVKQIKELLLADVNLTGGVECGPDTDLPVCNLHDGDLFPDTYRVARGTSRLALLDLMRKKMVEMEENWKRAGAVAPRPLKTWDDVVTLASIVQKETSKKSEMPIVASVYLNRLRDGMRLQADPTVVYALTDGLGDMRGRALLRNHLKIESPYNTYTNYGLPPAPIANVGLDAIHAVLSPADTNYLFFVADGKGGHRFAHTYDEHLKNHADWRVIKKIKNGN